MSPESMHKALDAIGEEAFKLVRAEGLPEEVKRGLDLIISLARYGYDVRSSEEKTLDEQ